MFSIVRLERSQVVGWLWWKLKSKKSDSHLALVAGWKKRALFTHLGVVRERSITVASIIAKRKTESVLCSFNISFVYLNPKKKPFVWFEILRVNIYLSIFRNNEKNVPNRNEKSSCLIEKKRKDILFFFNVIRANYFRKKKEDDPYRSFVPVSNDFCSWSYCERHLALARAIALARGNWI